MVPAVSVNYLAVLVAAVISILVGMVWYSPAVFGKSWMKSAGISEGEINRAKKKGMSRAYALMVLGSLVMAFVLAHFVAYASAANFAEGLQVGFWAWIGFVAPVVLGAVLWEGKPWSFYVINVGYQLVSLLLMGGLLATWA